MLGLRNPLNGYYDDYDKLVEDVLEIEKQKPTGIYQTFNRLPPEIIARCPNQLSPGVQGAKDADIVATDWCLIDIDSARVAGVSASKHELELSRGARDSLYEMLTAESFLDCMAVKAFSGNGHHLLIRCVGDHDRQSLKQFLVDMNVIVEQEFGVHVDTSVDNPSRVTKLYGTYARKGMAYKDRQHRASYIEEWSQV